MTFILDIGRANIYESRGIFGSSSYYLAMKSDPNNLIGPFDSINNAINHYKHSQKPQKHPTQTTIYVDFKLKKVTYIQKTQKLQIIK